MTKQHEEPETTWEQPVKPKYHVREVILFIAIVYLPLFAQAQTATPQQTLLQYVSDLQKSPSDDALRQKIIALVQTMPVKPKPSEDVLEAVGRASYAIKNATSDADFATAAEAFGKASQLAPWVTEYYFNQGVAYEKAKRFDDAIAAFHWYLIADPNAKDADQVRERIGGLKYAKEKAVEEQSKRQQEEQQQAWEASPEGRAAKERDFVKSLDGAQYFWGPYRKIEIRGYTVIASDYYSDSGQWQQQWTATLNGLEATHTAISCLNVDAAGHLYGIPFSRELRTTISHDGNTITQEMCGSSEPIWTYKRAN